MEPLPPLPLSLKLYFLDKALARLLSTQMHKTGLNEQFIALFDAY